MIHKYQPTRVRFASFELDLRTKELFKNGHRIPLQDQPAKVLCLLATHPGDLVTREDIQKTLWADGHFVDVDHGINAAIKKIRLALDDDPNQPKLLETLPKKGYRFIVNVNEVYESKIADSVASLPDAPPMPATIPESVEEPLVPVRPSVIQQPSPDTPDPITMEIPLEKPFTLSVPVPLARFLFLVIQSGYVVLYCAALYHMDELADALSAAGLEPVHATLPLILVSGMCGIAVRIYLWAEVGWKHPAAGRQFQRLFPLLLVLDAIWAASPLLAGRKIGFGLALAAVVGMAYLPFSQRTLMVTIAPDSFVKRGSWFSL